MVELPLHTVVAPVMLIVGKELTVIIFDDIFEQPFASVPVTEYVVLFELGVTVSISLVPPELHEYVDAPLAVNVVELPIHTVVAPVMLIVGNEFTVTVVDDIFEQPLASAPVTEYVVLFELGVTVSISLAPPELHEYVDAPLAESIVELPLQIVVIPEMFIIGKGFTVTMADAELEQPLPSVPVTEYEVLTVGLTNSVVEVELSDHIYELAPLAINVAELPAQIV